MRNQSDREPLAVWSALLVSAATVLLLLPFSEIAGFSGRNAGLLEFVLGGIGIIFGIVLGHRARGRIARASGKLTGNRVAAAGLVLGYVVLGLVLLVPFAIPFMMHPCSPRQTGCSQNVHHLIIGAKLYAADHHECFPPDLQSLRKYLGDEDNPKTFVCPESKHKPGPMEKVDE